MKQSVTTKKPVCCLQRREVAMATVLMACHTLAFIRHCRALDISLADVKRLLEFVDQPSIDCGDINRLIDAQLNRVRARLKSMQALEQQLTVLRSQCDENHTARECGILHELVAAAHGEACACHEGEPHE
jgi:DNA-binding transcriptional MerR regulator